MLLIFLCIFFFNDTATTEIYTLSLHDALPISRGLHRHVHLAALHPLQRAHPRERDRGRRSGAHRGVRTHRSEEHTSELQSPCNLVCRLLLEKKKIIVISYIHVHDTLVIIYSDV